MSNRVLLIVDGGSRGNPGPLYVAAYAEIQMDGHLVSHGPVLYELGFDGTNNDAEYLAIIEGVAAITSKLQDSGLQSQEFHLVVLSDSQLAVRQIDGRYNVEADNLKKLRVRAMEVLHQFGSYTLSWVPRDFTNAYLGC